MSDDLERMLMEAFRTECREHVEGIRAALAAVASGEAADLDEAFRHAHSLKAAARVCDFGIPAALGQRLEALFSRVRHGDFALDGEPLLLACQAADALDEWARAWEAGRTPPESAEILAALDQLLSAPVVKERPPEPATSPGPSMDEDLLAAFQLEHREHLEGLRALLAQAEEAPTLALVDEAFRRVHTLKGAARVAGLTHAASVAHRLESLLTPAREDLARLNPAIIRTIHAGLNFIEDSAASLLQGRPPPSPDTVLRELQGVEISKPAAPAAEIAAPPTPVATPLQVTEAVRVSTGHLDQLLRSAEQILTEGLGQDRVLGELGALQREAEGLTAACETARGGSGRQAPDVLDLIRGLEARAQALARHVRQTRRRHRQDSARLRLLGQQLQQDVRRARMVPAEGVFAGLRKMMRDAAAAEGKEVDFRTSGLDVQADLLVLQALKEPLMHVLRNAVCHGIEPPDERRRQGKEPAGRVWLRLRVMGNRLRLLVEDDGRGIDLKEVAAEAVRRGLLSDAEAATASEEELTRQVFLPAFSTSAKVTELAGRGMGLSVVQEAVSRLQGEIELTAASPGMRIVISVPLSISAQRLLLVRCQGQTFAVPTHSVERVHRARPGEIETVAGRPVLLLQGVPVPLSSLASMLGLDRGEEAPDPLPVVVVRQSGRLLAVAVDALLAEREAILQDLDAPAARPDRWAGAILLKDGAVCLVLNPVTLAPTEGTPVAPSPRKNGGESKARTILVVDDSLTTRTLEKSILEAHGYRVRLALDGLEALSQLRAELPDLVITDVQMPRLDGFGLLERMKQDARLARVPVIVVSSLEKRADQERGLALGADAYVVKRKFDHEELLQIIRQIL